MFGHINYDAKYPKKAPHGDTPLAIKRRENANKKTQNKRELLTEHQKNGTLTKAIIAQIYKMK